MLESATTDERLNNEIWIIGKLLGVFNFYNTVHLIWISEDIANRYIVHIIMLVLVANHGVHLAADEPNVWSSFKLRESFAVPINKFVPYWLVDAQQRVVEIFAIDHLFFAVGQGEAQREEFAFASNNQFLKVGIHFCLLSFAAKASV